MKTIWVAIKDGKIYGVANNKDAMVKMIEAYVDDNTSVLETSTSILAGDIRAEEWAITE